MIESGIYERLAQEGEIDELQTLASQNRAWLSQPSEAQRRQLLAEAFMTAIPDLLDSVSEGSKEEAEAARKELNLIAELFRSARSPQMRQAGAIWKARAMAGGSSYLFVKTAKTNFYAPAKS